MTGWAYAEKRMDELVLPEDDVLRSLNEVTAAHRAAQLVCWTGPLTWHTLMHTNARTHAC